MVKFFVFGAPKSGTTWLQMLLDAHPDISCRPEDQLMYFIDRLAAMVSEYNKILKGVDERTAKQGARKLTEKFVENVFKGCVDHLFHTTDKKISGINENIITYNADFFLQLFPGAKFIHIIRDPRSVALSSWHHNLRVEPGFIGRAHSLEEWCGIIAADWLKVAKAAEAYQDRENWVNIRYEDLYDNPHRMTSKLLTFLGADIQHTNHCVETTKMETLQKKTGNPFFRKGGSSWGELDKDMLGIIHTIAGDAMKELGYKIERAA